MYPLVLVCMSTLLINCAGSSSIQDDDSQTECHSEQDDWAYSQVDYNSSKYRLYFDDLQPLQQIVGDASIGGLGKATHGSHEFFTMKHRLLEFLTITPQ